ncbi:translocation/assembly module TamB domain-containing protein [Fulvimonas sp. R45]|uniref:translocation/assembly module TamB domain-containing protein n=1 Tax=Fulvimonas sp. R45 TaxID=3045937 RepID=UPI00265F743A|nr:translocation/assembly module TamB domain-containing protein [Fulvimonas sp. R45]MDO1530594.1 translocation/assembly module TamB domain-containing protein [Fulvimonas sp. R45]
MKWLKRLALAFAVLLLIVAVLLWWLLDTGAGLRFALARAEGALHGALTVERAQGRLLGPLDLAGVRYDDGQGTVAKVAKAHLDLRFWPLLRKRLHVLDLDVDGVDVALPKSGEEESSSSSGFSLQPPLALVLDRVHVTRVTIAQGGQPLFAANRLDLAARWTHAGIAVKQLALDAPEGHAELAGQLAIGRRYKGKGQAGFAWRVGDTDYAGTLTATSDGEQAHADIALTKPAVATLALDLAQEKNWPWTAKLDLPAFDPKPLLGDGALKTLSAHLSGRGDKLGGMLTGTLGLDQYTVKLQPLDARFDANYATLQLKQLQLASPQFPGSLAAHGTLRLDAKPVSGELAIAWQDLQLPADLAGQPLASHGSLVARGSATQYHAEGDVDIGPPGKLAKLALNLDGTPQQVVLHTLALKQPQGGLDASGTLTLQPALAWDFKAGANKLDPGQLFAGWNGALDFALDTDGTLTPQGPEATLDLHQLAGRLRDRALAGHGKLHLSPAKVVDGQLALSAGNSHVQIDARPGSRNDVDLKLAIASLDDWLPAAGGRLDGGFRVQGLWPALSVNGHVNGQSLVWQQQKAESLRLVVGVPDIGHPAGKLQLDAGDVQAGGLAFQQLHLLAEGSQASHRLTLDARGQQLSAQLALDGGLKDTAWNGTLTALTLRPQAMPEWRLQQPAKLAWNDGAASLSELCLSAGDPLLCVAAKQDKAGNLDASYRLHALPLPLLVDVAGVADVPMRAEGTLDGHGTLRRGADGKLAGNASVTSGHGSIAYADHPDQPLLTYDDLALNATLAPSSQHVELHARVDGDGRLDGQLNLTGTQQALAGQVELHLNRIGFIELFTNAVANAKGRLDGSFRLGGTLAQPAVTGQAVLDGFAAEIPDAGLKLSQGRVTVSTTDAKQFRIDGSVKSGDGTLAVAGTAGLGAAASTAVTLKGSRVTAADIPAAKVVISPDLVVKQGASGIDVGGSVTIDSADVNLEKLPGGGASQASPDVVIVDQSQQQAQNAPLPVTARVKVDLGRRTHIVGMGLDGRLAGTLTVSDRPGHATTGQGQIKVSGTYKAYGQNLHIEQGQLLFASTPVDNPGLNIKAVRKLNPNATIDEGQEVGLLVTGTAQRPVLTVFSNPVMEQSDALSYLVTGKPLSQVKGGEGNMVGAAAQALGSATGDLLAKSVGAKTGLDMGVSSSDALGGAAAFTVGKYLSPRLYLSYGVGLFDPGQVITLRFRLSHRWNFEAQNATDFSRASFNYRYER